MSEPITPQLRWIKELSGERRLQLRYESPAGIVSWIDVPTVEETPVEASERLSQQDVSFKAWKKSLR